MKSLWKVSTLSTSGILVSQSYLFFILVVISNLQYFLKFWSKIAFLYRLDPPITKISPIFGFWEISKSAFSKLLKNMTFFSSALSKFSGFWLVKITFILFLRGLLDFGNDSQVFRPIITALIFEISSFSGLLICSDSYWRKWWDLLCIISNLSFLILSCSLQLVNECWDSVISEKNVMSFTKNGQGSAPFWPIPQFYRQNAKMHENGFIFAYYCCYFSVHKSVYSICSGSYSGSFYFSFSIYFY